MGKFAVLFDMDGVLVDSEPVIEAAAIAGLQEFGVGAAAQDFVPFIGMGEDKYIGGVAEKHGVSYHLDMKRRVYEIYGELAPEKLGIYPGTVDLLAALTQKGWILALASSADSIKIATNLKVAGIDPQYFSAIVSGEDVVRKKPFPDIYLHAAEKLGVSPEHCVVVEDAINGVAAAKAAGMRCIGITTSFSSSALLEAGVDAVCNSIDEVLDKVNGFGL